MPDEIKEKKLTDKESLFIQEYIIDFNATRAAKAAGYSEHSARQIGCDNLAKPYIRSEIDQSIQKRSERTQITADAVITELARLGFSNMQDYIKVQEDGSAYMDLSKLTREQAAAISEITTEVYTEGKGEEAKDVKRTKVKISDKKGSLELLGKHLGIFPDKLKVDLKGNLTLTDLALEEDESK